MVSPEKTGGRLLVRGVKTGIVAEEKPDSNTKEKRDGPKEKQVLGHS